MKNFFNLALIFAIMFGACNSGGSSSSSSDTKKTEETAFAEPVFLIETSLGDIEVKLYEKTHLHRKNFEKLVEENYYDSVQFHRVIKDFMIQAGDGSTSKLAPGEHVLGATDLGYTVPAEFVYRYIHKKGALAAARQGDQVNPKKASSCSQFYIVQGRPYMDVELNEVEASRPVKYTPEEREVYKTIGGTPFLDQNYTVFGEVTKGLDIVDKIAAVETGAGDWPVEEVYIIKITKK